MPVTYTSSPSQAMPGQVVGRPVRLPYVMLCTAGERHCGRTWTANTRQQMAEFAKARREHEQDCTGGLIIPGR